MHEIEIKAALKDKQAVLEKLRSLGVSFGNSVTQDDMVYAQNVDSVSSYVSSALFLRLRTIDGGKTLFTLKYHPSRNPDSPESVPLEHELGVDSREEMEKILALLGFKEAIRIVKTRIKGTYQDWEICIDDLEGLGSFIEVEELASDTANIKSVQVKMLAFLELLGVAKADMLVQRYDIMLLKKKFGA